MKKINYLVNNAPHFSPGIICHHGDGPHPGPCFSGLVLIAI